MSISNSCRFFLAPVIIAAYYHGWPQEEVVQEQPHQLLHLSTLWQFKMRFFLLMQILKKRIFDPFSVSSLASLRSLWKWECGDIIFVAFSSSGHCHFNSQKYFGDNKSDLCPEKSINLNLAAVFWSSEKWKFEVIIGVAFPPLQSLLQYITLDDYKRK